MERQQPSSSSRLILKSLLKEENAAFGCVRIGLSAMMAVAISACLNISKVQGCLH